MFAVIYRGSIYPNREEEYQKLWRKVATFFVEHRGAIGSCLHKTTEGEWVAYSRWPDQATRDASWPKEGEAPPTTLTPEIQKAIVDLKNCVNRDQPFGEIYMDVKDDLLT